ncbi:MAG: UDP-GlcNAc--UDP-phosphate GlcNAc-1-phosphate transferase [Taibaiella sp.]|nr:UDP-GlcNAc--UDP-phosphate GlcNAc-1-phosphate transferase [Taibaiella sp.]
MNYILLAAALFVLELGYFKLADHYNIIDKPNERSSHTSITLRGGGIIFYFGAMAWFILSGFQNPYFFAGLTAITFISFVDDIRTLSNKIRLVIQFGAMALMFYDVGIFREAWWLWILALIICTGILNAYNFMDGINGITAAYSITVLVLLGLVNHQVNFIDQDLIWYTVIAVAVFAFFNYRQRAKCFAGDVGSTSIAFIIIFLLAILILQTGNPIYLLFLTVYGLDAVWTIVRRVMKGENISQAHRSHLYQYLVNEHKVNKLVVSGAYGMVQLLIGFGVIAATSWTTGHQWIFALTLLITGSVVYLMLKGTLIRKYGL